MPEQFQLTRPRAGSIFLLSVCAGLALACTGGGDKVDDTSGDDTGDPPVNEAPSAPEISITGETSHEELVLNIDVESVDPEGSAVTYSVIWTVDDVDAGVDVELPVSADLTTRDEVWAVTVTPSDGELDGESATASVTITNSLPILSGVDLGPDPAYHGDTLTCAEGPSGDPDGDTVTFTYAWTVNAEALPDGEPDADGDGVVDNVLDGALHFDTVQCAVTPDDGYGSGDAVWSNEVAVSNTAPGAPEISIAGETDKDDLICTVDVESTDADSDAVTYAMSWVLNGTPFADTDLTTTTHPGDTVVADFTVVDDVLACYAVPNDGYDDGPEGASAELTVVPSTKVYSIGFDQLVNLTANCSSAGEAWYNSCNTDWGFVWTDEGSSAPASVTVEMYHGIDCDQTDPAQDTTLNDVASGSVTLTGGSCSCNPDVSVDTVLEWELTDVSGYVPGGDNEISIAYATTCEGLTANPTDDDGDGIPDWSEDLDGDGSLDDVYAIVTVNY